MLATFLATFAERVTRHRATVLVLMGVLTLALGAALPWLETESSPENFIISFGDYESRVRAFREHFGDTDNVVVLLVEAEDALSLEALGYQHRLARHLASVPEVLLVAGLTVTPLPRGSGAAPASEATLDDLDRAADAPSLDEAPAEVREAFETLIAEDPEHFPLGMLDVANRVSDQDLLPVVPGDTVEAEHVEVIRAAVEGSPRLLEGRLVSRDRTLAAVVGRLRDEVGTGNERIALLDRLDGWLDANPPPAGVRLHRAGLPHLRTAIVRYMLHDQLVLIPLTVLVCVILLYASFRWLPATVLPLAAVGVCVVQIMGGMAVVGERLTILTNVLPTLIIIIELSNAVHLITRWEEELRHEPGIGSREAAARALRTMAAACFLTSFTSAVGLGSLLVSQTAMLRRFGVLAALGTLLAYTVTIFIIPAALSYLKPPKRASATGEAVPEYDALDRAIMKGTQALLRHPKAVLFASILAVVPAALIASRVQVDTSLKDTFSEGDPVAVALRLMDTRMDGIRPLEVVLEGQRPGRLAEADAVAAVASFQRDVSSLDGVLRVTSHIDALDEARRRLSGLDRATLSPPLSAAQIGALRVLLARTSPDPVAAYLTSDARHGHIELRIGDIGARRSRVLIDAIEGAARRHLEPAGLRVSLLGEAYIGSLGIESVVDDLVGSLGVSVLLIFLTLVLLFRSVRFAAIAVPPNVLPLITTIGWMVVRGIPLNAGTAIVFSIAVGVGVDGTIHALARFREEAAIGHGRSKAIVRTAQGTGRAIVISALTLMLGFAVLLLSSFVPIRHFGELIAAAMTASLVATLVVQPVLLQLFAGGRDETT